METPTLETEVHGQPFLVTGDEQSLIGMAEELRRQQQREMLTHIGRQALMLPVRLVQATGTLVARSVAHSYNEHRVMLYDRVNGTNFYEQLQAKRQREKDARMAGRLGLLN